MGSNAQPENPNLDKPEITKIKLQKTNKYLQRLWTKMNNQKINSEDS
jgi:hypothetical protein